MMRETVYEPAACLKGIGCCGDRQDREKSRESRVEIETDITVATVIGKSIPYGSLFRKGDDKN